MIYIIKRTACKDSNNIKTLIVIFLIALLTSCHKTLFSALSLKKATLIDSFEIRGLDVGQQVMMVQYVNDTTLCSYNFFTSEAVFFTRESANKVYTVQRKVKLNNEFMSDFVQGDDGKFYTISTNNFVTAYNGDSLKKLWSSTINHKFKYLKNGFQLLPSNVSPGIVQNDTLVAAFVHNDISVYADQFKEDAIAEFKLSADTIRFIRSYIARPKVLLSLHFPIQMYCYSNNTVHLIYPPLDTIYSYNRSDGSLKKHPINNPDYQLPEYYDYKRMMDAQYSTKYLLSNFEYSAFQYIAHRKEYLLFYSKLDEPKQKFLKKKREGKAYALVLDSMFHPLRIAYLPNDRKLIFPRSYFYIPNKGLAIPLFKGYDEFENTTFHIYSF